jgi:hypothetical protein
MQFTSQSQMRTFAKVAASRQKRHIGQTIQTSLFGRMVEGKIIDVHPFGTVDIELLGGQCYRVSGVSLST